MAIAMASVRHWYRQVVALLALAPLAFLFTLTQDEPLSLGLLGLGFADAAVIILFLTMSIGPAANLMPGLRPLLCWRRQLGIAVAVASGLHVAAFAVGDLRALPGLFVEEVDGRVFLQADLISAVSWIGLVAFSYACVLAMTSNDYSQRVLKAAWYRLHGHSYTFFVLAIIHTLIGVYLIHEGRLSTVFISMMWLGLVVSISLRAVDFVAGIRGVRTAQAGEG